MDLPVEFTGRVIKTGLTGLTRSFRLLDQIRSQWPESDIDVVYENGIPIVVVVFEHTEDALAYKLKYGENYA